MSWNKRNKLIKICSVISKTKQANSRIDVPLCYEFRTKNAH